MSSSRALCRLPSFRNKLPVPLTVVTIFFFVQCIIKQLLDSVFCDIQNNQGLGKGCQPQPSASGDNPFLDLDYSGYYKNLTAIIVYYSS